MFTSIELWYQRRLTTTSRSTTHGATMKRSMTCSHSQNQRYRWASMLAVMCALSVGPSCLSAGTIIRSSSAEPEAKSDPIPAAQTPMIAAGRDHTCAVSPSRTVKCWGGNKAGQLGDGTTNDRLVATPVAGLDDGIIALSAGAFHTCAVTVQGAVKCWGENDSGQLGDGTTINRHVPTQVSGLTSGIVAIAAGGLHTCAVSAEGSVKCWGSGELGQLGPNTQKAVLVPTQVRPLEEGMQAVSTGAMHSCAITPIGGVRCWGANLGGMLGNDAFDASAIPVHVPGLRSKVVAMSAGSMHTCALTTAGGVTCWGVSGYARPAAFELEGFLH